MTYATKFLLESGIEIPIEVNVEAGNIEEVMRYWNNIAFGGTDTVCFIQTGRGKVNIIPKDKIVTITISENPVEAERNATTGFESIPGVAIVRDENRTGHANIQNL